MKLKLADTLSLPIDAITNTFGVFGIRGAGKSNIGAVMAEQIIKAGQPVCIIDPTGAWYGLKSSMDGKSPGLPVYVFGGEHADVPLEPTAGEVLAEFMIAHRVPTVLDLKLMRKHQQIHFVMTFAEALFHHNREPLMLLIDEVARFAPQIVKDRSPEAAQCLGAIEDIITLGRNNGLGVMFMSQRPAPVSTTVRTQCENLICLRTIGKHDRKAIDEWVEAKGSQKERDEMIQDLASLPNGVGYFWSPGWLGEFKKVTFSRRETFDSGGTPKIGEKPLRPRAFAAVDTTKLSADIQATIERAKSEDPKLLQKRVAELNKKIAEMERADASQPVDKDALKKEFNRGVESLKRSLAMELKQYEKMTRNNLRNAKNALQEAAERINKGLESFDQEKMPAPSMPSLDGVVEQLTAPGIQSSLMEVKSARPNPAPVKEMGSGSGDPEVGKGGLSRMMIALAQRRQGLSARQLGLRATISSKSGTFNTYLSRGTKAGWIEGSRAKLRITDVGLDALGSYTPLPEGSALLDHWFNEIGNGGQGRMLGALSEAYPDSLTAQELGERAGISSSSGTFNTYLAKLRTLELVQGDRGALRMSDELAGG